MKRVIVDYKRLDRDVAALLFDSYPHGYGDDDIIILKKPGGEIIEAVELKTSDTIFLVKISKSLTKFIASFEETIENEISNDKDTIIESTLKEDYDMESDDI